MLLGRRCLVFIEENLPYLLYTDVGSHLRLSGELREAEEAVGEVFHHRQADWLAHIS